MSSDQQDVFKDIIPKLMSTIRAASSLAAQDVNFIKAVDHELGDEIDQQGRRLLDISNDLLRASVSDTNDFEPVVFGKEEISTESAWKPVSNILDSIFDRIDSNFVQANKKPGSDNGSKDLQYLDDGHSSIENETNQRVEKPQLKFKVPIDTSETNPFKPKITEKPHALVPFEDKLVNPEPVYEDNTEIIDPPYYAQPYEYEIKNQPYPDAILTKAEPIAPKDWNTTKAIWVDTIEELNKMIKELKKSTEIAVDLEHHDYRTYYGIVSLMQISNRDQDWIIDTIVLRDDLTGLNEVFADPNIVKVFHGAFMDIVWLQRDLGLYVVSLFDTYHASRSLGYPRFSLAYLLETLCRFKTSKKYQLADWRIRPLSAPMLAYARSDTHFLLYIYDVMRNDLIDKNKLAEVLYKSRDVAVKRFEYTKFRPLANRFNSNVTCPIMVEENREPWDSMVRKYNVPPFKVPVIQVLYKWRDLMARKEDESVRFIMPNQILVSLANLSSPVDTNKIISVAPRLSDAVRLHVKELAELIEKTVRQTEANDWDLVDKWNKEKTGEVEKVELEADEVIQAFESLQKSTAALFNEGSQLLCQESVVFKSIYNDKTLYSLEFKGEKVIRHNLKDVVKTRSETTWKQLSEDKLSTVTIPIEVDEDEENVEIEEDQQTPEVEATPTVAKSGQAILFSEDKQTDPNEVITLRKRNVQAPKRSKKLPQETNTEVDYANADKILLTDSKKRNDKGKKRSFDPYTRDSDGPKAAKKNKTMTTGRTSTYKKKLGKYK
ncbi:RRP6 Exosome complex exonuclease RRP6 [Candida maltosa Xu316]|uniref:Likely nuclear exosome component Rrp6p n=1 Tax=Candida maltosa (strain Xu316) TaxID=1245528 RepID=M3J6S1_CANMX|nr:Likely nuclear exosome component Rrp6p [Candida maltosa Xu316]